MARVNIKDLSLPYAKVAIILDASVLTLETGLYRCVTSTKGTPYETSTSLPAGCYLIHCNVDDNSAIQQFLDLWRDRVCIRRLIAGQEWTPWKQLSFVS